MNILKTLKIVSTIAVLLMATTVSAHVDLTETVPADEAMLMQSPCNVKADIQCPSTDDEIKLN